MTPTPTGALVIREKTIQAKFQRPPPAFIAFCLHSAMSQAKNYPFNKNPCIEIKPGDSLLGDCLNLKISLKTSFRDILKKDILKTALLTKTSFRDILIFRLLHW